MDRQGRGGTDYRFAADAACLHGKAENSAPDHREVRMDQKPMSDLRVGEFLVESGIISEKQLDEALSLQKDNKERLIGEILVTLGVLSKEDLIMAMEMYLMTTNNQPRHVDEWLDQDEIDMLLDKMRGKNSGH
jgi:hypothetical protein